MATLEENIRKIRGEAIYGIDIREAIAEGITQMDDQIINQISEYDGRLNMVKRDVDNRELFMNLTSLGSDDYKLAIINAS